MTTTETTTRSLVIRQNFPTEPQDLAQWVLWKFEQREGEKKATKVPYNAATGARADSTDPRTWSTFDIACEVLERGGYDGAGFVVTEHDSFVGIDLDSCVDADGVLSENADRWVKLLNSYTEVSPSLKGVRIWVKGKKPGGRCKNAKLGVEIYETDRFFTVTGLRLLDLPATVNERQTELEALYDEVFPAPSPSSSNGDSAPSTVVLSMDDQELIKRMCRKPGVQALWDGDISGHEDDHSGADLALCNELAFYTNKDADRMRRLFGQSGLYRPKWDRKDYSKRTIDKAIADCRGNYDPMNYRSNGSSSSADFMENGYVDIPQSAMDLMREVLNAQQTNNASTNGASIPIMITQVQRAKLRGYGYTDVQINQMKPDQAHDIIRSREDDAPDNAPDDIQESAPPENDPAHISVDHILKSIDAIWAITSDLEWTLRIKMLHALDDVIADIPTNGRSPIETRLLRFLKTKQSVDDFMAKIPAPAAGPVFTPFSFDDLLDMPEKEWIIGQVLGKRDVGMIFGPPGCGKTFVGINLIIDGCTGSQWAGRFDIGRALNIAYCAGEGISGLPARFKAAAEARYITKLPGLTFFKTMPQFFTGDDSITTVTIAQFVTEWKARQAKGEAGELDVLFIDTLHTATTSADENSAKDMGRVLFLCRWAANELNCAVVLVHHTNKNGSAERGSSALRGAMDFMIEIKRISETSTKGLMHCAKLKDGEQWKDQTFDLHAVEGSNSVCVLWDDPSDTSQAAGQKASDKAALKSEMERYAGKQFTSKRLAEAIDKAENYTRKLLSELEKAGLCQRELSDPKKKESSRNPWVYFIAAQQAEIENLS